MISERVIPSLIKYLIGTFVMDYSVAKLRILSEGDCPGLAGGTGNAITRILMSERGRQET